VLDAVIKKLNSEPPHTDETSSAPVLRNSH